MGDQKTDQSYYWNRGNGMNKDFTQEMTDVLNELTQEPAIDDAVIKLDDTHFKVENTIYELIFENHEKESFNLESFNSRFSDVLLKYDYIVGDWGFEQLRLRGFYSDESKNGSFDKKIGNLQDYLEQYCNFGCRFFVLEKDEGLTGGPVTRKRQEGRSRNNNSKNNRRRNRNRNKESSRSHEGRTNVKANTTKQSTFKINDNAKSEASGHEKVGKKGERSSQRNQNYKTQSAKKTIEKKTREEVAKTSSFKIVKRKKEN